MAAFVAAPVCAGPGTVTRAQTARPFATPVPALACEPRSGPGEAGAGCSGTACAVTACGVQIRAFPETDQCAGRKCARGAANRMTGHCRGTGSCGGGWLSAAGAAGGFQVMVPGAPPAADSERPVRVRLRRGSPACSGSGAAGRPRFRIGAGDRPRRTRSCPRTTRRGCRSRRRECGSRCDRGTIGHG